MVKKNSANKKSAKTSKEKTSTTSKKLEKINIEELKFDDLPISHQLAIIIFKMEEMIDTINDLALKVHQSSIPKKLKKSEPKKSRSQRILEAQIKQIKAKKKHKS